VETSYEDTQTGVYVGGPPGPPVPFYDRRFQPIAELGHGGMGAVFRCHDTRMARDVAVKIQRDPMANPRSRARFLREARLQGRLQHPSIVPVYEIQRAADGREFFVMREIDGLSLRAVLVARKSGASKLGRHGLLTAFSRVCMAIDYCHRQGVLHRDLKPENVMLGEFGEVYVLDWGLAIDTKSVQRGAGTRVYAAPEQLRGEATERSDVYSLGKILLEIVADSDPPPELVELGRRASSDDPTVRPESARALAESVDSYLEGERDLALRRRLADEAANGAKRAASEHSAVARRTALREAGRALALDPDHHEARGVLHGLLTVPPEEEPVEVQKITRYQREHAIRAAAAVGARAFLCILALMPFELAMSVRDPAWFALRLALVSFATLACLGIGRWWRATAPALVAAFAGATAVAVTSSLVLGPFVTIPSVSILVAAALALLTGRRHLIVTSLIAASLFAIPLVLEATGVIPQSMELAGDTVIVHARMLDLPPDVTIAYLVVKELVIIFAVGAMLGRFREVLVTAQRKVHVHAWQLEQLLPDDHSVT
jgi:eukaryotic-like serine/threonine-protein kinase